MAAQAVADGVQAADIDPDVDLFGDFVDEGAAVASESLEWGHAAAAASWSGDLPEEAPAVGAAAEEASVEEAAWPAAAAEPAGPAAGAAAAAVLAAERAGPAALVEPAGPATVAAAAGSSWSSGAAAGGVGLEPAVFWTAAGAPVPASAVVTM